jgi:hypothetical protein
MTPSLVLAGIAADAAGDVFVSGVLDGPLDFGCGVLPGTAADWFVAKLDPSGNCVWSKRFSAGGGSAAPAGMAVAPTGRVLLVGGLSGVGDFGGGLIMGGTATVPSLFALELDGAGAHLWSKAFGPPTNDAFSGPKAALDASGNAFLCGRLGPAQNLDFGGGPLLSGALFLAKLDCAGAHVWSRTVAASPGTYAYCGGATVDGSGNLLVAGGANWHLDFGGGMLPAGVVGMAYVAKLSGVDGKHVFSNGYTCSSMNASVSAGALALDAAGDIFLTGSFGGQVSFGGPPLTAGAGPEAAFVAKLDPAGGFLWGASYDGTEVLPSGLAVMPCHAPVVTGTYAGTVDFGNGPIASGPGVFLARLHP